ncbi:hypothetical protein LIER_06119 [Lithospermum erythrorhizon]|uniref:Uncharacterized protein n=1 Tax=Lithospermum erythrorhizon TaxID=34254 RepID=A0AAV3P3C5_LITER
MVQTLESIRGGGGSIKVGTIGTIGVLMSRELESAKTESRTKALCKKKSSMICASLQSDALTPRRKSRPSEAEAGRSNTSQICHKNTLTRKKTKQYNSKTQQISFLGADNRPIDKTPIRHKSDRKGSYMVEIVDIKCGNTARALASPTATRLKKLGFSKLSESVI